MRLGRHHGEPPLRWDEPTHVAEMNASQLSYCMDNLAPPEESSISASSQRCWPPPKSGLEVELTSLVRSFPVVKKNISSVQHLLHTEKPELSSNGFAAWNSLLPALLGGNRVLLSVLKSAKDKPYIFPIISSLWVGYCSNRQVDCRRGIAAVCICQGPWRPPSTPRHLTKVYTDQSALSKLYIGFGRCGSIAPALA